MQKQNTIMLWSSFPSSVFSGLDKIWEIPFIRTLGWDCTKVCKIMENVKWGNIKSGFWCIYCMYCTVLAYHTSSNTSTYLSNACTPGGCESHRTCLLEQSALLFQTTMVNYDDTQSLTDIRWLHPCLKHPTDSSAEECMYVCMYQLSVTQTARHKNMEWQ